MDQDQRLEGMDGEGYSASIMTPGLCFAEVAGPLDDALHLHRFFNSGRAEFLGLTDEFSGFARLRMVLSFAEETMAGLGESWR